MENFNNDTEKNIIFTKTEFHKLINDFLVQTAELDKTKPAWMTKNHIANLYSSLNEFYVWCENNIWK